MVILVKCQAIDTGVNTQTLADRDSGLVAVLYWVVAHVLVSVGGDVLFNHVIMLVVLVLISAEFVGLLAAAGGRRLLVRPFYFYLESVLLLLVELVQVFLGVANLAAVLPV